MAIKVGEIFQRFTVFGSHQAKEITVDVFGFSFFALAGGRGVTQRLVEKFGKTNARSQQIGRFDAEMGGHGSH